MSLGDPGHSQEVQARQGESQCQTAVRNKYLLPMTECLTGALAGSESSPDSKISPVVRNGL